jgi:hypothetical protein
MEYVNCFAVEIAISHNVVPIEAVATKRTVFVPLQQNECVKTNYQPNEHKLLLLSAVSGSVF